MFLVYGISYALYSVFLYKGFTDTTFFIGILTLNISVLIITLSLSKNYYTKNPRKYFELVKWFYLSFTFLFIAFLLGSNTKCGQIL